MNITQNIGHDSRMVVQLSATDIQNFFRPSKCTLRIYLKAIGEKEAEPGPYQQILQRLGQRHEKNHLLTFPEVLDLRDKPIEEASELTKEAVDKGVQVIYQAALKSTIVLEGIQCNVVGLPDFLIKQPDGYIMRDVKISRRITEKDHPEILRQLELYCWLFERTFNALPKSLQVYNGLGEIVEIPYDGGQAALRDLEEILALKLSKTEQYSPVGWTKCLDCGFRERCWPSAEKKKDMALVRGASQGLVTVLRQQGVESYNDLLGRFTEDSLSELKQPWGNRTQRVGKRAASIMRAARSNSSDQEEVLSAPEIPESSNYVMFDLEGLPPHLDELDKIFLWGMQVFGEQPGDYIVAAAGLGIDGDRDGWLEFLEKAKTILDQHGDTPFIHWHHYEKTYLDKYVERYGDPDGVAARVRENLCNLLPIFEKSIVLPIPSYSLKVVEEYIGFERSQDEFGGQWAMAKFIEATETEDETERQAIIDEVITYNREDLEATWAVLQWAKFKN